MKMRANNRLLLVFAILGALPLLTGQGAFAADTKSLKDVDARCVMSVPSSWSISQASAQSPDKAVSIVLISAAPSLSTLPEVRKHLVELYKKDKLIKDSGSELEMQGVSFSGKPNFVRAIPVDGRVCIAEIVYAAGTSSDAQRIVESLKAAH
jgi:hypothetical protein